MNAINGANLGWAVFASIFHIVALFTTVFRLFHRLRTSRMWWDDYMVTLPLAMNTAYFASLWLLFEFQLNAGDDKSLPSTGINSFWISEFIILSVIWLSRICIALTFARLFPSFHPARRSALFLAVMCFLGYLCCICIITFKCPAPPGKSIDPYCQKGVSDGGLAAASLHFVADIALILFPIIALWKLKLPQNLRSIIIWAFSGSALTLITVIIFCVVRYGHNLVFVPSQVAIIDLVCHLEAAVSLTVSNLLVIVSFFYRIFRRVDDIESADPPIATKTPTQVTEDEGFARETSIGQVSVLDTEDRPLSFTLTRCSQLIWSSMRVSEPHSFLTQNTSSSK